MLLAKPILLVHINTYYIFLNFMSTMSGREGEIYLKKKCQGGLFSEELDIVKEIKLKKI